MKKKSYNYVSPEISATVIMPEKGFAASEGFGTKELEEESFSFEWK